MITDNVQVLQSLEKVIDYNWEHELRSFEEDYEVEIQSQDDLEPWIKWCEGSVAQWEGEPEAGPINHVFYHLMVLQSSLPKN